MLKSKSRKKKTPKRVLALRGDAFGHSDSSGSSRPSNVGPIESRQALHDKLDGLIDCHLR
jgi:hypothetical protein